jgi:hypothetical protein
MCHGGTCVERLRETTKKLRIVGVPAEIRAEQPPECNYRPLPLHYPAQYVSCYSVQKCSMFFLYEYIQLCCLYNFNIMCFLEHLDMIALM